MIVFLAFPELKWMNKCLTCLIDFGTVNIKSSGGEIEFDHDDQTLNLIVQKDKDIEQSQQNDVKALSGGERSFT